MVIYKKSQKQQTYTDYINTGNYVSNADHLRYFASLRQSFESFPSWGVMIWLLRHFLDIGWR